MEKIKDNSNVELRLLLIEDNPADARFIQELLRERFSGRMAIEQREELREGLAYLDEDVPDVVLLDLNLPDSRGIDTLEAFQKHASQLPVIVLTGMADEELGRQAVHHGAQDYLNKGEVDGALLVRAINYGIERKTIQERLQRLNAQLEERVRNRTADLVETIRQNEQEIRERKKAEEALAAEKERLAVTLRSIGEAVISADDEGTIILLNEKAEEFLEMPEGQALGKHLQEIAERVFPGHGLHFREVIDKVKSTGAPYAWPEDIELEDHRDVPRVIRLAGAPVQGAGAQNLGVVLVLREITAERQREKELQRADKLESLGVLAGGISHDFNNILTAISGNIALARMQVDGHEDMDELLTEAEAACQQAKNLTQQLLTFAKGGSPVKRVIDLRDVVTSSARFSSRGTHVKCEFSLPEDIWLVEADAGQIGQVIGNLVINAVQAMPEGGIVRISAANLTLPEADSDVNAAPGRYVRVSIRDTGSGIQPRHLQRIFEPYFTTKQAGSGLGLASAYSIMQKHGGDLTVTSELGRGSGFHLYLPAAAAAIVEETKQERNTIKGQGHILIMDDDAAIRTLARRMLPRLGYRVEDASDGTEAIDKYKMALSAGNPFDLVILDLTIPGGMGGMDAFANLKSLNPNIKAIVSSGYYDDPVMSEYEEYGFKAAVEKPWNVEELSTVLHDVICEKPEDRR